jgi:hypothetical protein
MVGTEAMTNSGPTVRISRNAREFDSFSSSIRSNPEGGIVSETDAKAQPYEIRSEVRGPHWIAWISRGGPGSDKKPDRSIVIVGETQKEAEGRARDWAAHSPYR